MVLIKWRGHKILSGQHSGLRRVVWPWPLNIWPENQLESSTHWGQPLHQVWYWSNVYKVDNTLGWFDFDLWTCYPKINTLRATPSPSLVLIKWRGHKILSGQHSGLKRVVWPWPLNIWPENQLGSSTHWGQTLHQGGHKNINFDISVYMEVLTSIYWYIL